MNIYKYFAAVAAGVCMACTIGCADLDPESVGIGMMPSHDDIQSRDSVFYAHTRTISVDPSTIVANTSDCFLGCIIDPITKTATTCDYLAQFRMSEDFSMPSFESIAKDENGVPCIDSIDVTVYFDSFVGDSLAPMKLTVHEIDREPLDEAETYYINVDPSKYVSREKQGTSATYSIVDLYTPTSTSYYRNIRVPLDKELGNRLIQAYYANPERFSNPYYFTHEYLKGFYIEHTGGVGVISKIYTTALHIYFTYKNKDGKELSGMKRLASTSEVVQSSRAQNSSLESLLTESKDCTYLRSPGGLFTEVTLPVGEITAAPHCNDSINNARVIFRRVNSTTSAPFYLKAPTDILMVAKPLLNNFFSATRMYNGVTSFISSFNSGTNAYVFTDISNLIVWMKEQREKGAEDAKQDYATWEAEHPDWNKAVLVPVSTSSMTTTSSFGTTSKKIYAVHHYYGLSSVCLDGGTKYDGETKTPVEISIMYSSYQK